ncbi:hypothetical protein C8J56DRAFT_1168474 [Mycena floridula]|nr:hypothetical protein C8J56DRAFT_1168474 [Mycena floridula]
MFKKLISVAFLVVFVQTMALVGAQDIACDESTDFVSPDGFQCCGPITEAGGICKPDNIICEF